MRSPPAVLAILVVLTACGGEARSTAGAGADSVNLATLKGIPLMPGATLSGLTGGADAAEVTVRMALGPDSVAAWYRRTFVARGWTLVGDVRAPDGGIALHARDASGRPAWLMIAADASGRGTVMTVVGAVADTTRR